MLLYGPPGTGKTLLAKAIAANIDANFLKVRHHFGHVSENLLQCAVLTLSPGSHAILRRDAAVIKFPFFTWRRCVHVSPHHAYAAPGDCPLRTNFASKCLQVVSSAIVDKYIGESARLIREMFGYAKEHQPCIIFMDEIDAIGGRRFSEGTSADREIQRTLMELLSQLDGFDAIGKVKMIMATNRCAPCVKLEAV